MSDFQQRKFEKLFENLDADRDGKLCESDIEALVALWSKNFGGSRDAAVAQPLIDLGHKLWAAMQEQAAASSDTDNEITKEEWAVLAQQPEFIEGVAVPFALAVFDLADTDDDGKLSQNEMTVGQTSGGMSLAESKELFTLLDADGDGYVTRDEYQQAVIDFYKDGDPASPGHLMAGAL